MKNSTETSTAKSNESKKTFTIRKYVGGKLFSKFRTEAMSNDEFEDSKMNTESDWSDFLGYGSYSVVR